jgi:hypothetical protein
MNTPAIGLSRFAAAAFAIVITGASALAFVSSTASTDRDPFHFSAVMAANAQARSAHLVTLASARVCWKEPVTSSAYTAQVCRKG